MSTALSTVDKSQALAPLNAGSFRLRDQIVIKVPPQGLTKWTWSTILGEFSEKEIVGTIVALGAVQQDLWPHVGKAEPNTTPYMRSVDGVLAYVVGKDAGDLDLSHIEEASNGDGSYSVAKIKYFQWDKVNGRNVPPRANATSVVGILRDGDSAPLFVRLSNTSSPVVQTFVKKLRAQGVQPWQAVVSLGLEAVKGSYATYSRATTKYVRPSEPEYAAAYKACFDAVSPLLQGPTRILSSGDDVPF